MTTTTTTATATKTLMTEHSTTRSQAAISTATTTTATTTSTAAASTTTKGDELTASRSPTIRMTALEKPSAAVVPVVLQKQKRLLPRSLGSSNTARHANANTNTTANAPSTTTTHRRSKYDKHPSKLEEEEEEEEDADHDVTTTYNEEQDQEQSQESMITICTVTSTATLEGEDSTVKQLQDSGALTQIAGSQSLLSQELDALTQQEDIVDMVDGEDTMISLQLHQQQQQRDEAFLAADPAKAAAKKYGILVEADESQDHANHCLKTCDSYSEERPHDDDDKETEKSCNSKLHFFTLEPSTYAPESSELEQQQNQQQQQEQQHDPYVSSSSQQSFGAATFGSAGGYDLSQDTIMLSNTANFDSLLDAVQLVTSEASGSNKNGISTISKRKRRRTTTNNNNTTNKKKKVKAVGQNVNVQDEDNDNNNRNLHDADNNNELGDGGQSFTPKRKKKSTKQTVRDKDVTAQQSSPTRREKSTKKSTPISSNGDDHMMTSVDNSAGAEVLETPKRKRQKRSSSSSSDDDVDSSVKSSVAKQAADLAAEAVRDPNLAKQLLLSMALTRENPRSAPDLLPGEGHVIEEGFFWAHYPPLEKVLKDHMAKYYELSTERCQSVQQQEFNNWLAVMVRKVAAQRQWTFATLFNNKVLRDRIRCYYKTHIQNAKKRLHTMLRNPTKRSNALHLTQHYALIHRTLKQSGEEQGAGIGGNGLLTAHVAAAAVEYTAGLEQREMQV